MPLKVNEIFFSIQGESTFAGLACIFIRLSGCNLRCTYCDTRYALEEGRELSISQILGEISPFACSLVEITGGEPLLQTETPLLIDRLILAGYKVLLETNGSIDIRELNPNCIKILDVKCPSSGEHTKNRLDNLNGLRPEDQIKFVIADYQDYRFAKKITRRLHPSFPRQQILFSPVTERLPADQLAEWIIADRLGIRLQLQLHKIIWPHADRGV